MIKIKIFSQIEYLRPDLEALQDQVGTQISRLESAGCYAEARAAYMAAENAMIEAFTMGTIAQIRYSLDTGNEFYGSEMEYINRIKAQLIPLQKRGADAFLSSRFRPDFEAEFGKQLLSGFELERKLQSEAVVPDMITEGELSMKYKKTVAGCKTEFMGATCNFYGLMKHMESTDREVRKSAFFEWAKLYEGISGELDDLYDKLISVRINMAKKLGLSDYIEMAYLSRGRTDYTRDDTAAFRRQVRAVIVPAVDKLRKLQAKRLGVDSLKYYDEMLLFPEGNADPIGGKDVLVPAASRMYHEMSAEAGDFFDFMCKYELFDLDTRPGKQLGGYCTALYKYKAPYIFSNFNGTAADVGVLTHEAGHAFAGYTAFRNQPTIRYLASTNEINEIESMAMEHFAYPWISGFFGAEKAEKARYSHLFNALAVIPYIAAVDEFQHIVFEHPEMSAAGRRDAWKRLENEYMPWRDYDGVTFLEEGGFWMQKLHIFLHPFYYIDYALAQTCAFELYGMMKKDRQAAWSSYMKLCRSGGSRSYFELLNFAGLKNPFREGSVKNAVSHVIEELSASQFGLEI